MSLIKTFIYNNFVTTDSMTATLTPLQQQYVDTIHDGNVDNVVGDTAR